MCGLAATQLRAGAARLFYGTTNYVLCTADLGGLGRVFYPAHIGTEPLSRGLRHSTRQAPRPFQGSGPEQRISALVDSKADGCRRTMQSDGT